MPTSELRDRIIGDPERTQPIVPEALRTVYGLTPAEARLAIAIANGLSLDEIAALEAAQKGTLRSQLKAIFQKVGLNRQADLVKVLMTGPFRVNF